MSVTDSRNRPIQTAMTKKISVKIIIFYSALVAVLIFVLLMFFDDLMRHTHLQIIKREMDEKTSMIDRLLIKDQLKYTKNSGNGLQQSIKEIAGIINLRITLVDFSGNVIADSTVNNVQSMDNHLYRLEIKNSINSGTGESIHRSHSLNTDMLYYAKKSDNFIIRLAKPLYEIDELVKKVRRSTLLFGLFAILISLAVNIIISKIITEPIYMTIDFSEQFANGDFSKRILNYSDDEIGILQRSLNRMANSLDEKIKNLILEQNKLEVTLESINDGIIVIDNNKKILMSNRAFNNLFQVDTDTRDRNYYEIIRSSSLNSLIEHTLSSGNPMTSELELLNGQTCDVFINPIKEERSIQGALVVLHDITDRKKILELKTELIGNLSHELKTPIAILKGYLETIKEYPHDAEICNNSVKNALINVDRQNSIINDMLKLNMLETTNLFEQENVDIRDVIDNCIQILSPRIAAKGIEVIKDLDSLSSDIKANKFLCEEIFFNLADNAVNYNSDGGKIFIKAERKSNNIIISIANTGIGIPGELLDKIFERFYRVDKSRSRSTGGTGLGLSIVKHATGLLNWKIKVTSDKAATVFTLEVPYQSG